MSSALIFFSFLKTLYIEKIVGSIMPLQIRKALSLSLFKTLPQYIKLKHHRQLTNLARKMGELVEPYK
jgi:hypothetical protein